MILDATLHEIVGVLETEAEFLAVTAQLSGEAHNAGYAAAKLSRAARLRGFVSEIQLHLRATPATPGDDAIAT